MTVITGEQNIENVRLLALRSALRLEIKTGMRRSSRGRATSVIVADALGLQGKPQKATVYKILNSLIVERLGASFDRPL